MKRQIICFSGLPCSYCIRRSDCSLQQKQKEAADEIFKAELEIEEGFGLELKCFYYALDEKTLKKEWKCGTKNEEKDLSE